MLVKFLTCGGEDVAINAEWVTYVKPSVASAQNCAIRLHGHSFVEISVQGTLDEVAAKLNGEDK
jgi:hypothetical protein